MFWWLIPLLICITSVSTQQSCPSGSIRLRPALTDLSEKQFKEFTTGFRAAISQRFPSRIFPNKSLSIIEEIASLHNIYKDEIHNKPLFLPWHRFALFYLEERVRELDTSLREFVMPYWNWTIFSQSPWHDPVLSPLALGDTRHLNQSEGCLTQRIETTEGPIKYVNACCAYNRFIYFNNTNTSNYFYFGTDNIAIPTANSTCLRRAYIYGSRRNQTTFHTQSILDKTITTYTQFNNFSHTLETLHGIIHDFIGGDMSTMDSPHDLLFWAHHSMVDKIYSDWHLKYGYTGYVNNTKLWNTAIPFFNETVGESLLKIDACVSYVPSGVCFYSENRGVSGRKICPTSYLSSLLSLSNSSRSTRIADVAPNSLSRNWIKMNKFTDEDVRKTENVVREWYKDDERRVRRMRWKSSSGGRNWAEFAGWVFAMYMLRVVFSSDLIG